MPGAGVAVTYGQLDSKGRVPLGKPMQDALGLGAGSSVAFVKIGDALVVVPQDKHLEKLASAALRALDNARISVGELLEDLPAARDEVVTAHYGAEFLADLERVAAERADAGTH